MKARSLESAYIPLCFCFAAHGHCPGDGYDWDDLKSDDWSPVRYWAWHPVRCYSHRFRATVYAEHKLWEDLADSAVGRLELLLEQCSLMGEARHETPGRPPNWDPEYERFDPTIS